MTEKDNSSLFPQEVSKIFDEYQGVFVRVGEGMGGVLGASLAICERSGVGERCVDHLTSSVRAFGDAGQELRGMLHSNIHGILLKKMSRAPKKAEGDGNGLFHGRADCTDCQRAVGC